MVMIGVSCMAISLGRTVPPRVRPGHRHGTKRRKRGVKCSQAGMTAVTEAEPLPTMAGMNKSSWKLWVAGAAALAIAGGSEWWWTQGRAAEVVYRTARIERGSIQANIA